MIHIVRTPTEDSHSKTGLGGYADLLEKLAISNGHNVNLICTEISRRNGIIGLIKDDFLGVFKKTLCMKKKDVCHYSFEGLAHFIPFCRAKKIVTVHHIVTKEENNPRSWYFFWKISAKLAIKYSDQIIAISEQTKTEIVEKYNVDSERIQVISHLANDSYHVDNSVKKKKWIGAMGSLVERKNFLSAVRVFSEIIKTPSLSDFEFHICGKGVMKDSIIDEATKLGISDKIVFHQDLSESELNEFYNRCTLTLNTSLHEGLGMLSLESQLCGTPVMYYDYADIPKNTTKAAISCENENDMVKKSISILTNEVDYRTAIQKGLEYVKEYRKNYVQQYVVLYSEDKL